MYTDAHSYKRGRRGFSAVELLVVIGILLILVSIFIPYLMKIRETDHRVKCADNLRMIRVALNEYASANHGDYPSVIYDSVNHPNSYTCFTGADGGSPFAARTEVRPNDVTASLWLLVRLKLADPEYFICPSTDDIPDDFSNAAGRPVPVEQRGNFRDPVNLSYSYASPFSSAAGYKLNDTRPAADFKLIADKNPGASGDNAAIPPFDAPPLQLSVANSNNHGKAGQNVLFEDGHVEFEATPYCGAERDNIYTALAARHSESAVLPPKNSPGVLGRNVAPAWASDSYLVPTANDLVERPSPTAGTQPATSPATLPTTIAAPISVPMPSTVPIIPPPAPATQPAPSTSPFTPASTQPATTTAATTPGSTTLPSTTPTSQPR